MQIRGRLRASVDHTYAHRRTRARSVDRGRIRETISMSTLPRVRARVYKINLLSDAIKYLSTGSRRASAVHRSKELSSFASSYSALCRRSGLCFCRRYRLVLFYPGSGIRALSRARASSLLVGGSATWLIVVCNLE